MKYFRDRSKDNKKPTHNRLKGEEAAKYEQAGDERDIQPEGIKYKGVKHKNRSDEHSEGEYDRRSDDTTMRPSQDDE
jgi:hypothetical protein